MLTYNTVFIFAIHVGRYNLHSFYLRDRDQDHSYFNCYLYFILSDTELDPLLKELDDTEERRKKLLADK